MRDLETELLQDPSKQEVVLEAIAAASAGDQLAMKCGGIDVHAAAEQDVEVLERDVRRMCRMQSLQRRQGRVEWPGVADPGKVCVEALARRLRHAAHVQRDAGAACGSINGLQVGFTVPFALATSKSVG